MIQPTRPTARRLAVIAASASAAALLLAGCSAGGATGGDGAATTLTLGSSSQPLGYDTDSLQSANYLPYFQAVYDSLIRMEPDGTLVPMLAEEWNLSEDKLVLTLELRDDVTFSDGTAFDSEAVKANMEAYKASTAPDASFLKDVTEVVPIDADTVEVHLASPNPGLPTYLTRAPGLMISPAALGEESLKTQPVGSGPYLLDAEATVVGSTYVYTQNPDYWAPELVHYDNLTINYYPDPASTLNALRGGQLNGAFVSNADAATVEAAGFTLNPKQNDFLGITLFDRAGTVVPALADVRVRQAINHAVNGAQILETIGQGKGTVTQQIFPPSSEAYDESLDERYPFDPEKARELLAEAGYADGFDLPMPTTAAFDQAIYATVAQQLGDVGIRVVATDVGQDLIADLRAPEYPATVMQFAQPIDWQIVNEYLTEQASWNVYDVADETIAGLVETIQFGDEAEAAQATTDLNAYIVEQAWFAPWYRGDTNYATDASTTVQVQTNNSAPYIYNYAPKG